MTLRTARPGDEKAQAGEDEQHLERHGQDRPCCEQHTVGDDRGEPDTDPAETLDGV